MTLMSQSGLKWQNSNSNITASQVPPGDSGCPTSPLVVMSATIACPIASPTCVRAITAYLTDIHVDETYDFFAAKSILIRALGFTAAGATVSIPVPLAHNPQKRVDYHLQQLTKALQEQYPEAKLLGRTNSVSPQVRYYGTMRHNTALVEMRRTIFCCMIGPSLPRVNGNYVQAQFVFCSCSVHFS
jgi:hypothetical protein